jgi:hypothetical protein
MRYTDYKAEAKKMGITKGDFFNLMPGENRVRILSQPEAYASHYIQSEKKFGICTMGADCFFCQKGISKSHKVMVYIVDRVDEEVKRADLPWSVFKSVAELSQSADYKFEDLPPYDIIITKTGEGMETRYSVVPGRNEEPITEMQKNNLSLMPDLSEVLLKRMSKNPSKSEEEDVPDFLKETTPEF